MDNYLDVFIEELLHVNEGGKNKLIDLYAGDPSKTYFLTNDRYGDALYEYALAVINEKIGKTGNTILRGSSTKSEQTIGKRINDFDWQSGDGSKDPRKLDKFIDGVYKERNLKGNNPLFLSVGSIKWKTTISKEEVKTVESPIIIFPIQLIRSAGTTNVCIEFILDDAYINPCFIAKFRDTVGEQTVRDFPHPNSNLGSNFDEPVSLALLGDGREYFKRVETYVRESKHSEETVFELNKNCIAIAQYNHGELCMYYDIKRNKELIYNHPLVQRLFRENKTFLPKVEETVEPHFVLPYDSYQSDMIRRVVNGESMIIQGPPGTGKTLTIANMIASLIASGKKVLLSSKKLSALAEVHAKLPEDLRKFVMLLDYETEAQASKVNPVKVRQDFKELLKERKEYSYDPKHTNRYNDAKTAKIRGIEFLEKYVKLLFGKEGYLAEDSYYDALDTFLKNDKLPRVEFTSPLDAIKVTREQLSYLTSVVKEAEKYYRDLTHGHPLVRCPWIGVENARDTDGALKVMTDLAHSAEELAEKMRVLPIECCDGDINLYYLYEVMKSTITDEETALAIALDDEKAKKIKVYLESYIEALEKEKSSVNKLTEIEEVVDILIKLEGAILDGELKLSDYKAISDHKDVLTNEDGTLLRGDTLGNIVKLFDVVLDKHVEYKRLIDKSRSLFEEDVVEDILKNLDTYVTLTKYTAETKPKLFDGKSKKAFTALSARSYRKGVEFSEVVSCVKDIFSAKGCLDDIDDNLDRVNGILRRKLSGEEVSVLYTVFNGRRKLGVTVGEYFGSIVKTYSAIDRLSEILGCSDRKVSGIVNLAELALAETVLCNVLSESSFSTEKQGKALVEYVIAIVCVKGLFSSESLRYRSVEDNVILARGIRGQNHLVDDMTALFDGLHSFGEKYFLNHFTAGRNLTVGDLRILSNEGVDRNILSASARYFACLHDGKNILPLDAFFAVFEEKTADFSLVDTFEHSFFGLLLDARMATMRGFRNGLGAQVDDRLEELVTAYKDMEESTVKRIEKILMGSIDDGDDDFAFLSSERNSSENFRSFFKKHSKGILKLTKCFMLSPSTASVLFRPSEYNDFDIVIVDEASQLEPVNILPVLFRAKQCVIVGDEWQMPPIKHFVTKYEKRITTADGTETVVLEPEISVLSLASKNNAFRSEQLVCHYRSKTESLITYSQRRFYKGMRTFPAPVPMREGLGFVDVYVEDGNCERGINEAEATKVIELLNGHFDKYYDEEKGTLSESVGVVAFGEEQINKILDLVEKDRELYKKIGKATAKSDVPEKVVFFKTIETVQGQETNHLILSLTYGKVDGKIISRFGQLNQGNLGRCIFNVAVTRAKSSVTMVHSVRGYEVTGTNVAYIKEYLEVVERYSVGGREQFVSEEPAKGFLRSVAAAVEEYGIDAKRIVFNYGVTDGSVRIPIAVLSEDLSSAQLGIWCEKELNKKYNYLDYNMRYVEVLKNCGWNLHRIYAHDWVDNQEAELNNLKTVLKKYVK